MSSLENFTICWNDFDSHLRSSVRNLRHDSSFCDVSLICEDFQVKAHKVILASSSLIFSRILRSNPHPHPLIYLNNVKMKDIIYLLNYMYSGQIEVTSEDIAAVVKIFREFKVKGFDPDSFISDNSLASSINQGVQSFATSWINQHVLDISIKTEDDDDDSDSVSIFSQSFTNQPFLTCSEDNVGSTGSENLANDCSMHTDATHPSPTQSTINQSIHTDGSQHVLDISIKTEDGDDDSNSVSIFSQSYTNQPCLTCSEVNVGFTISENLANECSIHTDATHPSVTQSTFNQNIHTDDASPSSSTPYSIKQNLHTDDASPPSSINQAMHTDVTSPSTTTSSINQSIHTDATHPSATQSTINQNIHTDDASPPSTINQAIHTDVTSPSTMTSSINQSIHTDATHLSVTQSTINQSIHTDATQSTAMPSTINQNIHTDDGSSPFTINQAIHPSTTQSSINQSIHTDVIPPSTPPSSINKAIHTDATPSKTPSSINKDCLPVPGDEQVKCASLNSARQLRSSNLSLQPKNVKLSSEPSCLENSRNQDASSTSNLPYPRSPIFTKKNKGVKNSNKQQILENTENNVGSTGSESLENDCSIHKDATHPSATPSIVNKIHDKLVNCGSLNSARHLRSSSLSLQSESVKLSFKPSFAENSLEKETSSTSTLPRPTKKHTLNSVIIKAIENIKSRKKGPNLKRIAEVARKLQPKKESISAKDVLKQLDEAVEQGVVQRTRKLGKVTYRIT